MTEFRKYDIILKIIQLKIEVFMFTAVEYVKENLVFALNDEVHKISDALIKQNLEAYRELAK